MRRVPPHFTLPLRREEVDPNGSVNLTCVAVGSPMPFVRWRDGATELGEAVIGKNVLELKNVTESKNYTCVASSDLGNIEHVGEVIVRGKTSVWCPPHVFLLDILCSLLTKITNSKSGKRVICCQFSFCREPFVL